MYPIALTSLRAAAGADIILLARQPNDETVTSTTAAIRDIGQKCKVFRCDLSVRADVLSIVQTICKTEGLEVDIIVHCGGLQYRAPAVDFPDEKWDEIINVNLTAGFILSREFAKYWLKAGSIGTSGKRKKIIFIASLMSFTGSLQIPAYSASKGAIGSLTKSLNNEWMGQGINVNAIAPGYIETELTAAIREDGEKEKTLMDRLPIGRWGVPEDMAGATIHLASRGSDFVGGEVYVVDGGFNAR